MTNTAPDPVHSPAGWAALLTGGGPAAIAVVRVWGPAVSGFIARHIRFVSRHIELPPIARATLLDDRGCDADDILLTLHPDRTDIRLHVHGNPVLVDRLLSWVKQLGFEVVEPGHEPAVGLGSRRTGLAGVPVAPMSWPSAMHVIEADVWQRLPSMKTERGARWLLSQAGALEQEIERIRRLSDLDAARSACQALARRADVAEWFSRPLRVVLLGPPNAGKSTLVNALTGRPVSVVTAQPGTTRDWVEAPSEVAGFPVCWLDTAGIRESGDPLEAAGVERSERVRQAADEVIVVLDGGLAAAPLAGPFIERYRDLLPACVAINKCDLWTTSRRPDWLTGLPPAWLSVAIDVSAERRCGLEALADRLLAGAGREPARLETPAPISHRLRDHLGEAASATEIEAMRSKLDACLNGVPRPAAS